jgi:hypothetical protein
VQVFVSLPFFVNHLTGMSGGTFNPEPFAEGRHKLAYMGQVMNPPYQKGKAVVVKKKKAEYTWEPNSWEMSKMIQQKAKELATKFEWASGVPASIRFTDVNECQVTSSTSTSLTSPRLNEFVLIEDYLQGNYTKWCSNGGYISPVNDLMPAFMHWSWVHTGGEVMIADLQGVQEGWNYHLTDPALLSNTMGGMFGCTDLGVEGMARFFLNHNCKLCLGLPRPTNSNFPVPPGISSQLQCLGSTAYIHEMKIPDDWRQHMIFKFPKIAKSLSFPNNYPPALHYSGAPYTPFMQPPTGHGGSLQYDGKGSPGTVWRSF